MPTTSNSGSKLEQARSGPLATAHPAPVAGAPRAGATTVEKAAPRPATAPRRLAFSTVGIGASAGGLEALLSLLGTLSPQSGLALVIVTHQQPDHQSLLPELLSRRSSVPVVLAADGLRLEPNRVYVSPPGKLLGLSGGVLRLTDASHDGALHLPIDFFFRALAVDQEDRAICIVLSGTGTDGTLGLRAVKGHGGLALAQDEQSAQYPGMPMSAAATLLVDCVLPPHEMPALLLRYAHSLQREAARPGGSSSAPSEGMQAVLGLLHRRSGHDFRGYKAAALARRIERRMRIQRIEAVDDYVALLEAHPLELDVLFSELLISVTSFFRDPEVFRALGVWLGPRLAKSSEELPLRAWVAACSTGEEAYSLAMLLAELGMGSGRLGRTQVFATDIDSNVIEHARRGSYPPGIAADVGAERLEAFFDREGKGYRVAKNIRERCVFALQDLLKDPPFTKLDLLSCRNLLIYLDAKTQQQLIPLFHYALEPGGLLLLGASEAISGFERLFKPLDRRHRIYERLPQATGTHALLEWHATWPLAGRAAPQQCAAVVPAGIALHSTKLLLERFAPPTLIVDERGDILYVHGRTGRYLELASGAPQNNLWALAREGLHGVLAAALRRAANEAGEIVYRGARVRTNGEELWVDVIVQRLAEPEALRGLFRVSLDAARAEAPPQAVPTPTSRARAGRTAVLERELQQARHALQGSIEALQSSNEELKSMNEELQSTNEELQTSNEQLQTSKEELSSMNDELGTLNLELQAKVEALSRANDDLANLLESTDIATLILDPQLRIKRFTELTREVINLIPGDIGRPLRDLASHLRYARLVEDARGVLESLRPHEVEVQTNQGSWRLMRIIPYRTSRGVVEGVTVHFLDIDRVKRAELLAASRALAESIVHTVHEPLAVLDEALNITTANPAFLTLFELGSLHAGQTSLFGIGGGVFARSGVRALLQRLLAEGTPFQELQLAHDSTAGGPRQLRVNARRLLGPVAAPGHLLLELDERRHD